MVSAALRTGARPTSSHWMEPPRARTCVLVLCGLPGAGKSTLTAALASHPPCLSAASPVLVSCVSFDQVEREHAARQHGAGAAAQEATFDTQLWREARAHAYSRVEALLSASTRLLAADGHAEQEEAPSTSAALCHHLVVVDDNMYYRSMRHRVFQLARSRARPTLLGQGARRRLLGGRAPPSTHQLPPLRFRLPCQSRIRVEWSRPQPWTRSDGEGFWHADADGAAFVTLHVELSATEAHARNQSRATADQVPEAVIERMASRLEPPNSAEFPWERAATVRPDRGDNLQCVWESVWGLWGTAPPTAPTAEELAEKEDAMDDDVAAMSEATEGGGREQEGVPPIPPV